MQSSPFSFVKEYGYSPVLENGTQYDTRVFRPGETVEARYIRSAVCPGNPLIEALPPSLPGNLLIQDCENPIPFDRSEVLSLPFEEQSLLIGSLEKRLKIFLPTIFQLNLDIRQTLINAYTSRYIKKRTNAPIFPAEFPDKSPTATTGKVLGSATYGFYCTGKSQCGKTTSVNSILPHIPPVIVHTAKDGTPFHQVPYLKVECPHRSNFRALYTTIGRELDSVLDLPQGRRCEEYLTDKSSVSLAEINNRLRRLVDAYGIGLIILDECQNLHFNASYDNSVTQLLFLSNATEAAFGFIGTSFLDEGYVFDAESQKTVCRLGHEIHADAYCRDPRVFRKIVKAYSKYQVFDPEINPLEVPGLFQTLYNVTCGSVGPFQTLWIDINKEYIACGKHAEINTEFIRQVIRKNHPHLFSIIALDRDNSKFPTLNEENDPALPETGNDIVNKENMLIRLKNRLSETFDGIYPNTVVYDAVDKAYSLLPRKKSASEDDIRMKAINILQGAPAKSKNAKIALSEPACPPTDYVSDYISESALPAGTIV